MSTTENGRDTSPRAVSFRDRYMEYCVDAMPEFHGVCDPIAAMLWITKMELIFDALESDDEEKVAFAVSKLTHKALFWWDNVKDASGPETARKMTWSQFKEVFKEEFRPMIRVMKLVEEFFTIKQGSRTVQEYISRFEELWWFIESHVTPEELKTCLFVKGLKANIQKFISSKDMTSFQTSVNAALAIESRQNREMEERSNCKRY
uniref:uncharacterized protein LOC122580578 n=1 Tax=Erigeron canadensis TaxID=72917 RepID=UPI001CB913D9|nr:uncharacterized protein LOC122580578 [Erigeron canadensis]